MFSINKLFLIIAVMFISSCASYEYSPQVKIGQAIIAFSGNSLDNTQVDVPSAFKGKPTILLFGYVQDAQFDIDRWLIGLDMVGVTSPVFEIPTIKGMFPRMFSTTIDDGMRRGIPKDLWKGVVTVYEDGDKVQRYTGNINPNNTRVILIDAQGTVLYFYDEGFAVAALNELKTRLDEAQNKQ